MKKGKTFATKTKKRTVRAGATAGYTLKIPGALTRKLIAANEGKSNLTPFVIGVLKEAVN